MKNQQQRAPKAPVQDGVNPNANVGLNRNFTVEQEGSCLTIRINLDGDLGLSASQKMRKVAGLDKPLEHVTIDGIKWTFQLNLWRPVSR
jgi:hypothetical protein